MLRKANNNDLEFIYGLYMHPQINPWLLYEPMDIEDFKPIYKDLIEKQIIYVYEHEREEMGMCKLVPQTFRNSHIMYLGGLGIHPGFAGKGHGAKLLREIVDLCRTAGYKRIELSVSVRNEKAIHLYEKVNFDKEGVLRKFTHYEKDDEYVDEVLMACLL